MITNYTNAKSSVPHILAKVVVELEQQKTGHINFFKSMLVNLKGELGVKC